MYDTNGGYLSALDRPTVDGLMPRIKSDCAQGDTGCCFVRVLWYYVCADFSNIGGGLDPCESACILSSESA